MHKITATLLFFLCLLPLVPAQADTPENEIIYRTNLGRSEDVELLLKGGVSPDHRDKQGVPLLALAAARPDEKQSIAVMKALLAAGGNVNITDPQQQTALFYAARKGNSDVVQFLLDKKIDYYATDKYGDIARTIAHRNKHENIVKLMDDFVKQQSAAVHKQYEDYNNTILAQRNEQEDALLRTQKENEEKAEAEAKKAKEDADKTKEELEKQRLEEEEKAHEEALKAYEEKKQALLDRQKELVELRSSPEFEQTIEKLAFENCAYQYWYFTSSVNQTMELSLEEVDEHLDRHKGAILNLTHRLLNTYKLSSKYVNSLSVSSKQRIFHELDRMPSRSYRFQRGVGKISDMEARCNLIARSWDRNSGATIGKSRVAPAPSEPVSNYNSRSNPKVIWPSQKE